MDASIGVSISGWVPGRWRFCTVKRTSTGALSSCALGDRTTANSAYAKSGGGSCR